MRIAPHSNDGCLGHLPHDHGSNFLTIAVLSDVHANFEALKTTVADARRRGATRFYCLGDLVGYNALPHETLRLLRDLACECIRGNHDVMALEETEPCDGGPNARQAIRWTRSVLSQEEHRYLRDLPDHRLLDATTLLVHSALDDPFRYLRSGSEFLAERHRIRERYPQVRVCFTGHTHRSAVVEITPDRVVRFHHNKQLPLQAASFYFVNPGSVGHPRDSDYRASYLIYDRQREAIVLRRVAYDRKRMLAANARYGLHVDLGPSVLSHLVRRITSL